MNCPHGEALVNNLFFCNLRKKLIIDGGCNLIITHSGKAHVDEFLACSLLLNKYRRHEILRVANPEDYKKIKSPTDIIVDATQQLNPEDKIYDHHQDVDTRCSLYLVLHYEYNYRYEDLDKIKALKYIDYKDRLGPFKASKEVFGIEVVPREVILLEPILLNVFSRETLVTSDNPLHALMIKIGESLINLIEKTLKRMNDYKHLDIHVNKHGVKYCILNEDPDVALLHELHPEVQVVVTPNNRNQRHTSIVKVRDAKVTLDLINTRYRDKVVFYHPNKFLIVLDIPISEINPVLNLIIPSHEWEVAP